MLREAFKKCKSVIFFTIWSHHLFSLASDQTSLQHRLLTVLTAQSSQGRAGLTAATGRSPKLVFIIFELSRPPKVILGAKISEFCATLLTSKLLGLFWVNIFDVLPCDGLGGTPTDLVYFQPNSPDRNLVKTFRLEACLIRASLGFTLVPG